MKPLAEKQPKADSRLLAALYTFINYARAFFIIALCLWTGNLLTGWLGIAIPGSIIGLLILFSLLVSQLIPATWVKDGCKLFMQYMTLLFIPAAMGIMDSYNLLLDNLLPIVVGCLGSSVLTLLAVAYLTEYLQSRTGGGDQA